MADALQQRSIKRPRLGRSLRNAALASSALALGCWAQAAAAGPLPATAFQTYDPTTASTIVAGPTALYTVPVGMILPTQANEGFTEVGKKAAGFDLLTPTQLQANLLTSIEPVIIGPGGKLYLTDGHHTFTALDDSIYGASNPTVYVNVIANYSTLTTAQFYATLQSRNFLLPLDNGVPETVSATGAPLPTSLTGLTNDLYRGLEYSILKNKNAVLFPTAANITGAIGSTTPGLDKMTGYYADFFEAAAYRAANGGLGLPTISAGDIALSTQWNLNAVSATTLPNVAGTVTAAQLPGFILAKNIVNAGGITNAVLSTGAIDGNGGFTAITSVNLGTPSSPITVGTPNVGFIMQLGNDRGFTVTLNGVNTYTGGTSILAGTLVVQSDASLGAATPTGATIDPNNVVASVQAANGIIFNSLTEGNGTLTLGTATGGTFATNRPIAIGSEAATINVNGNVATLTGQLVSLGTAGIGIGNASGFSDLTIDDLSSASNGRAILSTASPNFYGNVVIGNIGTPTVTVMNDAALGNTTGAAITIGQVDLNSGTLQIGASFAAPERNLFLGSGSNIDLAGFTTSWGTLTNVQRTLDILNSSTTAAGAITFSNLTIGAASTLQLAGGTAGETVTLTNGIVRPAQDTLILQPTSTTSLGGTEKLLLSNASLASLTNGIAPVWIVTTNGVTKSAGPYDFVTYGANGYVRATYTATTLTSGGAAGVVALAANSAPTGNVAAYALNTEGRTITLGTNTLTIGNGTAPAGLILATGSAISGGTLAFGGSEGVIWLSGTNATISSTITGTNGLTFSGSGAVAISKAATVSGLITVDAGTLTLSAANIFSGDVAGILLDNTKSKPAAATLAITASNAFTTLNAVGNNSAINLSNGAALTIGDTVNNLGSSISATVKETGAATLGALTLNGSGLFDFTGGSKSLGLVSGSTIVVNNSAQLRVVANDFVNAGIGVVLNGTSQLQFAQNGGGIFANAVSGTGALRLIGGTLQITGTANSYSGGTFVETGSTLDITTANLPTGNPNITAAGGLVLFDQAVNGTYAGIISDGLELGVGPLLAGSFDKDDSTGGNAGNVTLTQAQQFSGKTYVEAGTLTLGAVDTLATSSSVDLGRVGGGATATLALAANNAIRGLSSEAANTAAVQLGANALTIGTATGISTNFGGTIAGTGGVTVTGTGTQIFSGANSYSGGTTVGGGTLALTSTGTLGATAGTLSVNGGTLDFGGSAQMTGAFTLAGGTVQNGTLTATGYAVHGGIVSVSLAGTGSLTASSGVTTLSGVNSYSGGTVVTGGTLALTGVGTLGATSGALAVGGGTLDLGGTTQTVGALTLASGTIQNGTLNATGYAVQSGTISAVLGGTGGLTKTGAGIVTLSAANTYTGATDVQAGTLRLGIDNALSASTALTVETGATLDLNTHNDVVGSFALYGTLTGGGLLSANTTNLYGGTLGMALTGTTVNQVSGTTSVTGTVAATNLAIMGGTLQLAASDRIGDATAVTVSAGATLDLQAFTDTVGTLALNGTLAGTGTLTASSYTLNGAVVNANLGAGTLTQSGGLSTLNGTEAATTVNVIGGTLTLGGSDRLADAAAVNVASGGTLNMGAFTDRVGTLALNGTLNGTGTLTAASYTLNNAAVNANLGTGTLTQAGGTSVLTGSSVAGTVAVNAGTLRLGAPERIADTATLSIASGATFDLAGYGETVGMLAGSGTVALGAGTLTTGGTNADYAFGGNVTGAGDLTKVGTGTFSLAGNEALTGRLNVNGGTLMLAGTTTGSVRIQGGTLTGTATIAGNLLLSSGTLSPGTATQPVATIQAASLTVTGGTTVFDFGGTASGFAADLLKVTGAATIGGGTVTTRGLDPTANYKVMQTYTILQAGSLTGMFANGTAFTAVSNNSDLAYRLRYDLLPNGVVLEIRKQIDFTANLGTGATGNELAVATALNGNAFTASDSFATTLNAIAALSPDQRRATLDNIGGESVADISTSVALIGGQFTGLLRQRMAVGAGNSGDASLIAGFMDGKRGLDQVRASGQVSPEGSSFADGSKDSHAGAWVQTFGGTGRLDGSGGTATLQDQSYGVAAGIDAKIAGLTVGGAFAASALDTRVENRSATNKGTLYQGGGYVAYDSGTAYASAVGSYFSGDIDSSRQVYVGSAYQGNATGTSRVMGYTAGGAAGYRLPLGGGTRFTPQVSFEATHVDRGAFTETGAGGLSLSVGKDVRNLYAATVEGRLSHVSAAPGGIIEPYAGAGVAFNFGDLSTLAANRFTGAPTGIGAFSIQGARLAPTTALVNGGIEAHPNDRVTLGMGAETRLSDRQREASLQLHVRLGF